MAHRIVEPLLTQVNGAAGDSKYLNQTDTSFRAVGRCFVAVRNVCYQNRPLTEAEWLLMDNHFQVLERAYFLRNRKHNCPTDFHRM